ncbi:MAG: elongation factor EF-2 [Candidatus Rehaiarchaeum fermentans]|nr:elongation factor EF-2 [Candidatus Rehaiarchaeum fermentans]
MPEKESLTDKVKRLMQQTEKIRNIGIIAHIDHGKTTTADNLLAGCGMLSEEKAGKALVLDFEEIEQERQMTVKASNVNMVYERPNGEEYLINLIDTPGHVDFGGHVTRAIRSIDGAIVVVDSVEGARPQTEMTLRQALQNNVKPVLYINKIDRLVNELKLDPKAMQEWLTKIINQINNLIKSYAREEYKQKWQVSVQNETVAFGASLDNWAISISTIKETGIGFQQVYEAYKQNDKDKIKELSKKSPVYRALLEMVVKNLPNPKEAQRYRIPIIWKGDLNSQEGKSLLECDSNGTLMISLNSIEVDPQAGEIAVCRIFSGKVKKGQDIYLINNKQQSKAQLLYIWKGAHKFQIEEAVAGNIIGIGGLKDAFAGETISSSSNVEPFEPIKHILEPVMVKAIEPKDPKDLPKLTQALHDLAISDITLKITTNQQTGEILIAGLGPLHLEIVEDNLRRKYNLDIITSPPIVVYKEGITKKTQEFEGKSPNKHNKLYVHLEPLSENILKILREEEVPRGRIKNIPEGIKKELIEAGMTNDEIKRIVDITGNNIFIDNTRGILHIGEIIEMCAQAFEEVMKGAPQCREEAEGVLVSLDDAVLHEDAIHRGPAQIIPAMKDAIIAAFLSAGPILLEPIQIIRIDAPSAYINSITALVQSKRGTVENVEEELGNVAITIKIPVAETFNLADEIRSVTEGRGSFSLIGGELKKLPDSLYQSVVKSIRERKGLQT